MKGWVCDWVGGSVRVVVVLWASAVVGEPCRFVARMVVGGAHFRRTNNLKRVIGQAVETLIVIFGLPVTTIFAAFICLSFVLPPVDFTVFMPSNIFAPSLRSDGHLLH